MSLVQSLEDFLSQGIWGICFADMLEHLAYLFFRTDHFGTVGACVNVLF
ncbi:hypothetical protein P4N68_08270 [Corynebacterium felinum]|uniref:Uncharacterized protein n=1 Tax=Corynebacterium felinum TaxID=131318 RepID=A0ABU2B8I5_9CORY|nr:hypothetical protein [Corynebacterium felinum]MDF5821073.1 hypothetical protein [Corynebacterium felinum]MDR7354937.1 hypothetical protein [Corynebacterium felinum]